MGFSWSEMQQAFGRLQKAEDINKENEANRTTLKRTLKLWDLIGMGVGSTMGAGVYILSGDVAVNKAGPAVTLCFAVAAVVSILSGICYAELGSRVPRAGSGYAYLYSTLGELPAFIMGWCLLMAYLVGTSSVASSLTLYLDEMSGGWIKDNLITCSLSFLPGAGFRDYLDIPSVIIIFLLGALLCTGVEEVSKVTNALLACNILTICLVVILCLFNVDTSKWGINTEFGSADVPAFFLDFYNDTNMVKGVAPTKDSDSFVNRFCQNGNFEAGWYKTTDKIHGQINRWNMSCELADAVKYSDKLKDEKIWLEDTAQNNWNVRLDVDYTKRLYSADKTTNKLTIEDSWAGTGGYIPFSFAQLGSGITSCFYGFLGFDVIATTGEEAINPQENIPKAITYSLFVICTVYFTISGLLTLNFPYFAMDAANPFAGAVAWNGFGWACKIINIGACCALTASLIGAVFPMPRILYSMGHDGLVYSWAGQVNKNTKVPQNATIVCTLLAALLAAVFDVDVLIDFMSIASLAAFALVAGCVIILRFRPSPEELKAGGEDAPTTEQGDRARTLIYILSALYLVGFLVTEKFTKENAMVCYVIWGVMGAATLYVLFMLSKMKTSKTKVSFMVPCVPYVPLGSLAANIYLMAVVDAAIWWKMGIWLVVGMVIYVTYGVKNSREAGQDVEKRPLNIVRMEMAGSS